MNLQERAERYANGLAHASPKERSIAIRAYRAGWWARVKVEDQEQEPLKETES